MSSREHPPNLDLGQPSRGHRAPALRSFSEGGRPQAPPLIPPRRVEVEPLCERDPAVAGGSSQAKSRPESGACRREPRPRASGSGSKGPTRTSPASLVGPSHDHRAPRLPRSRWGQPSRSVESHLRNQPSVSKSDGCTTIALTRFLPWATICSPSNHSVAMDGRRASREEAPRISS